VSQYIGRHPLSQLQQKILQSPTPQQKPFFEPSAQGVVPQQSADPKDSIANIIMIMASILKFLT